MIFVDKGERLNVNNKNKKTYGCKNPECGNSEIYNEEGYCPQCGMKFEKYRIFSLKKARKENFNPNRKWRIVEGRSRLDLYFKIEKYEKYGYELILESLSTTFSGGLGYSTGKIGVGSSFLTYSVFMKKKEHVQ